MRHDAKPFIYFLFYLYFIYFIYIFRPCHDAPKKYRPNQTNSDK